MITYEAPTRIEESNLAINNLTLGKPFLLNQLLVSETFLKDNSDLVAFRPKYEMRPDLLAYEEYGNAAYYPILLFANNVGSLFQFTKHNLNNQCIVPRLDFLQKYLL